MRVPDDDGASVLTNMSMLASVFQSRVAAAAGTYGTVVIAPVESVYIPGTRNESGRTPQRTRPAASLPPACTWTGSRPDPVERVLALAHRVRAVVRVLLEAETIVADEPGGTGVSVGVSRCLGGDSLCPLAALEQSTILREHS